MRYKVLGIFDLWFVVTPLLKAILLVNVVLGISYNIMPLPPCSYSHVNTDVNAVLGIRYFSSRHALVPLLLKLNMEVGVVLGIRYFSPVVLLRVIQLVNVVLGIGISYHTLPPPHALALIHMINMVATM